MTTPRQPDLFAAEVAHVHAEVNEQARLMGKRFDVDPAKIDAFDFARDSTPLVPGSLEDVPEWLRIPLVDDPDWMPAPAVGKK